MRHLDTRNECSHNESPTTYARMTGPTMRRGCGSKSLLLQSREPTYISPLSAFGAELASLERASSPYLANMEYLLRAGQENCTVGRYILFMHRRARWWLRFVYYVRYSPFMRGKQSQAPVCIEGRQGGGETETRTRKGEFRGTA